MQELGIDDSYLQGGFNYISTTDNGNPFLGPMIACKSLKANKKLLLVSFQDYFSHYNQVFAKFNVNLTNLRLGKRATVFEAGAFLLESYIKEGHLSQISKLYEALNKSYSDLYAKDQDKSPVIIIDQLETLLVLGYSVGEVIQFLQSAFSLIYQTGCIFVSLRFETENDDALMLNNALKKWANYNFHIRGLKTGMSEDLSGSIEISSSKLLGTYHFRLEDRTVKTFAPGTSAAVL
ncbi:uncharacterized protein LOC136040084 [Artemia franciscana]|uniref:uncharacterized protein LOC136040084 n=1 Tax=Artemia franciscana TaxID=6661 RepID=UPI0032D9FCEA